MLKNKFKSYIKLRKEESKYMEDIELTKLKRLIAILSLFVFLLTFITMNSDNTIYIVLGLFTEVFILLTLYDRFLLLFCNIKYKK